MMSVGIIIKKLFGLWRMEKRFSRREALKYFFALAVSAPILLEELKNALIGGVGKALVSGKLFGGVNEGISEVLGKFPEQENAEYRPMVSLVRDAICSYQSQSGGEVFYQKDQSFKSAEHYKGLLDELKQKRFYGLRSNDFATVVIKSFDSRQRAVYESSFNFFLGLQSAACPGSGYYHRLRDKFGESLDGNLGEVTDVEEYEAIEECIYEDMSATRSCVEEAVLREQRRVSTSMILGHFLSKNRGNIGESLFDTAIFLKFMTRNNIDERGRFIGDSFESEGNIGWMRRNVRDEFDGPAYTQLEQGDQAGLNLIGKPYHSWSLVSLLQFFPESVIQAGCYYELFKHVDDHGVGKIKADVSTLSELGEIESLLSSYAQD